MKKFAARSLPALVFAISAGQSAHAHNDVRIQSLELTEETQLDPEEFRALAEARLLAARGKKGQSDFGSYISSGNYANYLSASNYANYLSAANYSGYLSAGNYADYISAGNYANYLSASNYAQLQTDAAGEFPSPVVAETVTEE